MCTIPGCALTVRARGLCSGHNAELLRTGKVEIGPTPRVQLSTKGKVCTEPDCGSPVRAKGLCTSHYNKKIRSAECPGCGGRRTSSALYCTTCHLERFQEAPPEEKECTGCARTLPIEEFGWRRTSGGQSKVRSRCRQCERDSAKDYRASRRAADPEGYREQRKRERVGEEERLRGDPERWMYRSLRQSARMLGVDPQEVLDRYEEVGNVCESCGWLGEPKPGKRVHVDHCHTTGRFRGLLCSKCNLTAGHWEDSPEHLRAVANYLERWAA